MPNTFHFKKITDAIHGSIGLSEVEAKIVSSRAYQRLHNVKQLGLAHLVFPGAGYSRFSHSIGACHNASRLVDSISRNSGKQMSSERKQAFRLVGLLHDIGHYPFSHATEEVIENYYTETEILAHTGTVASLEQSGGADTTLNMTRPEPLPVSPISYGHEELGAEIIRHDQELSSVFQSAGIDKNAIADLFSGRQPDNLIGIISSDLDCDRLDYLRRTAHFSGAPYGTVDIDFIIDQATCDAEGRFCLLPKALRAADHLLVSRYYDYMQVPFHKTVAALEWSLVSCLRALLDKGLINCSGASIRENVESGRWSQFDDQHVFERFKALLDTLDRNCDAILRDHILAILGRNPAKMVHSLEEIRPIADRRSAAQLAKLTRHEVSKIAGELGLDEKRIHIWELPWRWSKINGSQNATEEQIAEAIHILDTDTGKSSVLNSHKESLIRQVSNYIYAGLRIYYLPPDGKADRTQLADFRSRIVRALAA